ncbi:MAG: TolC family protein [bacterium]
MLFAAGAEGGQATISLDECLRIALSQNPNIEIEKIDYINAVKNITVEKSVFDPDFSTGFSYADSKRPTSSVVTGNRRKTTEFQIGYGGLISNGDSYGLSLSQVKSNTNSQSSSLNPSYTMDITLDYTKPLFRGRGRDVTLSRLRITKLNSEISGLQLKAEVMDIASQVESAYWGLVYARENLKVKDESLRLANETLSRTKAMVEAGAMADSQVLLVEAQAASREEDVIEAEGEVRKAVLELKLVMNVGTESELWAKEIAPGGPGVEEVEFELLPFDDGMKTALANRPDYLGVSKNLEVREVETTAARNRVRPSVDLVSSVGVGGLQGEYSASLQDVTSLQYPSWEVGLWMELPVGRREARARLEQSVNNEKKAGLEIDKAVKTIAVELAGAEVTLQTARKKMEAAKVTREYAEQKLKEEEEKHILGLATTHDVLEYQEDLEIARLSESRAIVDFNESVTSYYYLLGTLLEQKGIEIAEDRLNIFQQ